MNLFAYGTLMDPEIMSIVSGVQSASKRAVLQNYIRRCLRGKVYPAIIEERGSSVDGVVYFDLLRIAADRLDQFEGSLYLRTNVIVTCEDIGQVEACAYVMSPNFSDLLLGEEWDYQKFFRDDRKGFKRSL